MLGVINWHYEGSLVNDVSFRQACGVKNSPENVVHGFRISINWTVHGNYCIKTKALLNGGYVILTAVDYCQKRVGTMDRKVSTDNVSIESVSKGGAVAYVLPPGLDFGAFVNALPGSEDPIFSVVVARNHEELGEASGDES